MKTGRVRRILLRAAVAIGVMMWLPGSLLPVSAGNATAYTYTISQDEEWMVTQDAYLVSRVLMREHAMTSPRDLFVKENRLYLADTGASRVLIYQLDTGDCREIGGETLSSPVGLFVDQNNELYVADNGLGAVVKFSPEGEVLHRYDRPDSAAFGTETTYSPSKVAVNSSGTLYVVSDGSYDGMIQLDQNGEFLGYFGYNNNPITAWEYLQDLLFTDEMKAQLFSRVPYSFGNVDIDTKGILYSVTQSAEGNAIKKHDVAGLNLLTPNMEDEQDFVDVCIGTDGQIYAVTATGLIFEYDMDGHLLFTFGGRAIAVEQNGVFATASAIASDSQGRLYVLDGERGLVHVMAPSNYAKAVHTAMREYSLGHYAVSYELWNDIISIGGASYFATNNMAQCLFQEKQYDEAAALYRASGDREGYSQSFWHIRNQWLSKALPYLLLGLAVAAAAVMVCRRLLRRRQPAASGPHILRDDAKLLWRTVRHPIDSFYSIRHEGAGHISTALVIYALAYLLFIAYQTVSGFVLIGNSGQKASLLFLSLIFLAPLILFILSNFLVGEVKESNARFRDILVSTAYILAPFVVAAPILILISHVLTTSELRLFQLAMVGLILWMVVNLLIATREMHAYDLWPAIRHLLITVFLMCVIVLALSMIYMFWDQLTDFVLSIIKEVGYHGKGA
ncbi:YIP1 family protein [Clostridia bacterium]